jgi:hypothetical protein
LQEVFFWFFREALSFKKRCAWAGSILFGGGIFSLVPSFFSWLGATGWSWFFGSSESLLRAGVQGLADSYWYRTVFARFVSLGGSEFDIAAFFAMAALGLCVWGFLGIWWWYRHYRTWSSEMRASIVSRWEVGEWVALIFLGTGLGRLTAHRALWQMGGVDALAVILFLLVVIGLWALDKMRAGAWQSFFSSEEQRQSLWFLGAWLVMASLVLGWIPFLCIALWIISRFYAPSGTNRILPQGLALGLLLTLAWAVGGQASSATPFPFLAILALVSLGVFPSFLKKPWQIGLLFLLPPLFAWSLNWLFLAIPCGAGAAYFSWQRTEESVLSKHLFLLFCVLSGFLAWAGRLLS